jgi:hypothetical protein
MSFYPRHHGVMARSPIEVNDTNAALIGKMAEGNTAGLTVVLDIMKRGDIRPLLSLDDMNMRGDQIWYAYRYHCGQDMDLFLEKVRARDPEMVDAVNGRPDVGIEKAVTRGGSRRTPLSPFEQAYEDSMRRSNPEAFLRAPARSSITTLSRSFTEAEPQATRHVQNVIRDMSDVNIATVIGGSSIDRAAVAVASAEGTGQPVYQADLQPPLGDRWQAHADRVAEDLRKLDLGGRPVVYIDDFQLLLSGPGAKVLDAILARPNMRVVAGVPPEQEAVMRQGMRNDPVLKARMEMVPLRGRGAGGPSAQSLG